MAKIYRTISLIIPHSIRKRIKNFLSYSSVKVDHDNFIGFVTSTSILLGIIAGFFLGLFFRKPFWIFFLSVMLLTNIVIYLWLIFLVDKKVKHIEKSLPDALQLMASNLRAGMTPDKALLLSARPEFGPLKDEIDIVGRKVTLGKGIGKSLMEMAHRVKSKRLVRAVELINSGLNSGGNLATLLEATSNNLREQILIDKKIKASITMYFIFIFSAAAIIAPILFGLSSFLVEVLGKSFSQVDIPSTVAATLPIEAKGVSVGDEFLVPFIVIFLTINNFMAAMVLGLIGKGKHREGIKFFIPMILLAIPIFFLARIGIRTVLGGLFNF
jgi:archaeal flagellar protein FlaJ